MTFLQIDCIVFFLFFFKFCFSRRSHRQPASSWPAWFFFLRVNLTRRVVQTHCVQIFAWCFTFTAILFQQKIWQAHFNKNNLVFSLPNYLQEKNAEALHQTTLHFSPRPKLAATVQNLNYVSTNFWFLDVQFSFLNNYAPKNALLETKLGRIRAVSGPYQGRIRAVSGSNCVFFLKIWVFSHGWTLFVVMLADFSGPFVWPKLFLFQTKFHQANSKHICWQSVK